MGALSSSQGNSAHALICVVDDDESVRRAMDNLLKSAGYASISFDSGESCLASARRGEFALAVLDVKLGGMSGFALQQCLAAADKPLPLVFVSAHGDLAMERRALDAGAIAFLRKPIDVDLLLEHIARALAARENPA
jgi:FixJ family two-component response regulator